MNKYQERDGAFRAFSAWVCGKVETCSYTATCECGEVVDYTDHIIRNVLLNWIYDFEIRKQVQSNLDYLDLLGLDEIVRIVEGPDNREYEY